MKLSPFVCVCFFFPFFFETPLKDFLFYSSIILTLWFRYLHTQRKAVCILLVNFSSKLPIKLKNSTKNPRKMHFPAIYTYTFQKFLLHCLPCGHPTEPPNQANSKETESLWKNNCRQKCLDKSLIMKNIERNKEKESNQYPQNMQTKD